MQKRKNKFRCFSFILASIFAPSTNYDLQNDIYSKKTLDNLGLYAELFVIETKKTALQGLQSSKLQRKFVVLSAQVEIFD